MRKIKRFSINESGFVLSPEEMRRINGGGTPGCLTVPCYVYDANTYSLLYTGTCGGGYDSEGYAVCSCNVSSSLSFPGGGVCDDN